MKPKGGDYQVGVFRVMSVQDLEACLANKTPESLGRIVNGFSPMVMKLALRCSLKWNLVSYKEDLFQEGLLAVWKAAQRWDAARGVKFITFAHYYALGYMCNYVDKNRTQIKIPKDVLHKMQKGLLDPDTWGRIDRLMNPCFLGQESFMPTVPSSQPKVEFLLDFENMRTLMRKLLTKRNLAVLWSRLKGATMQEAALRFGVSRERIRQIENNSLTTLRRHFGVALCQEFTGTREYQRTGRSVAGCRYSTKKKSSKATTSEASKTPTNLQEYYQKQRGYPPLSFPSTSDR